MFVRRTKYIAGCLLLTLAVQFPAASGVCFLLALSGLHAGPAAVTTLDVCGHTNQGDTELGTDSPYIPPVFAVAFHAPSMMSYPAVPATASSPGAASPQDEPPEA